MFRKCPTCGSIWVCWNWVNYDSYLGNTWGHECWKCDDVFETTHKVKGGVPYWILKNIGKYFV